MEPGERAALKQMLDAGNTTLRSTLVMAGEYVARVHDVALNASNGMISDPDFVRNYLRSEYRSNTVPGVYTGKIRGVAINPEKFEQLAVTGVAGDIPADAVGTAGDRGHGDRACLARVRRSDAAGRWSARLGRRRGDDLGEAQRGVLRVRLASCRSLRVRAGS